MTEPAPISITRALLSVSDKTGLVEFARFLADRGVHLLSTGGSARTIREAGIPVTDVSEYTDFPEMMGGRVKTLHPMIHGGILARRDDAGDRKSMETHGIGAIDLVVINLYPFEATVASGADFDTCIENIDIGGPALIRSAAKNHAAVTVVVDPADYDEVTAEMTANDGSVGGALRRRLAARAYARTAAYDAAIAHWFAAEDHESLPERLVIGGRRAELLRYGENPHQQAAFYRTADDRPGVTQARQLQGKALSYNNINDTDAAFELAAEFDGPAVAIIKHANPCGVASAPSLSEAYDRALACDPVSAYGGIIAVNRPLDGDTAAAVAKLFAEVVIAPEITEDARKALSTKKNLRVLETGSVPDKRGEGLLVKTVAGGLLVQTRDNVSVGLDDLKVVTKRTPTEAELADLLFAFSVCKHVKSNAIVYAKGGATVGIGAGQMSRVDSARIAVEKSRQAAAAAGESGARTEGAVVASDAFFPFADGLIAAAEAGVTAVIQPGGSLRDEEVIAAADERGLAMVFTGVRHFRH